MWTKMRMTYLDRIFKDAKDFILFSCCNGIGICLLKKKKEWERKSLPFRDRYSSSCMMSRFCLKLCRREIQGRIDKIRLAMSWYLLKLSDRDVKFIILYTKLQGGNTAENWIKDLLSMALPTRARPTFPESQSLPSGSFHKPLILIH